MKRKLRIIYVKRILSRCDTATTVPLLSFSSTSLKRDHEIYKIIIRCAPHYIYHPFITCTVTCNEIVLMDACMKSNMTRETVLFLCSNTGAGLEGGYQIKKSACEFSGIGYSRCCFCPESSSGKLKKRHLNFVLRLCSASITFFSLRTSFCESTLK